ncbi:MAG: enoyl-CoA hydratase/isomerase family protein [Gammaproteobacteria bacterium]|nr:enoyl-CoA hydratase/isomerase family protein [Gammaproteobacteria bacterium]
MLSKTHTGTQLKKIPPLAVLTLNRPDCHNALDDKMLHTLIREFKNVEKDKAVKILILQAEGKHFSAGADLTWMKKARGYSDKQNIKDAALLATLLYNLYTFPKPCIAKVQGAAFGGAIGLLACCDTVIATRSAQFCFSESRLGLVPAVILPFVISAMGSRALSRYVLTAEPFSADEAYRLQLVHEVVSDDKTLQETAEEICQRILKNGPHALIQAKAWMRHVKNHPLNRALLTQATHLIAHLRASKEGQEGLAAFLEKRSPEWCDVP